MRSLRDLLTRWRRSSGRRRDEDSGTTVARFIVSSRERTRDGGFRLEPSAFLPRAGDTARLELSVFRTDGLDEAGIWSLARDHVVPQGRNLHGRADLTRRAIETTTPPLRLLMDDTPPRHGNVLDWPAEEDERLALAQELAARARHFEPTAAA